jgi:hypothetical protein
MCSDGLHSESLFGHLGANEHPSILFIRLGGSPSSDFNFFFSPLIEGVESNKALV